jgi:hypothetical protein
MRTEKVQSETTPAQAETASLALVGNGAANQAGVIDQVRELLFGETKRTTEQGLKALEERLEALTATMEARFSEMESRMAQAQSDAERSQASAIDDIGAAIAQLGASIRNMSGARVKR